MFGDYSSLNFRRLRFVCTEGVKTTRSNRHIIPSPPLKREENWGRNATLSPGLPSKKHGRGAPPFFREKPRAQLFEGRLALNLGFFFLCLKAFSRIIFSVIFKAFDNQLVDKKN